MVEVYLIMYDSGSGPTPLGGYPTLEEAQEIIKEMRDNNPDTEYWLLEPIEVDPDARIKEKKSKKK